MKRLVVNLVNDIETLPLLIRFLIVHISFSQIPSYNQLYLKNKKITLQSYDGI